MLHQSHERRAGRTAQARDAGLYYYKSVSDGRPGSAFRESRPLSSPSFSWFRTVYPGDRVNCSPVHCPDTRLFSPKKRKFQGGKLLARRGARSGLRGGVRGALSRGGRINVTLYYDFFFFFHFLLAVRRQNALGDTSCAMRAQRQWR